MSTTTLDPGPVRPRRRDRSRSTLSNPESTSLLQNPRRRAEPRTWVVPSLPLKNSLPRKSLYLSLKALVPTGGVTSDSPQGPSVKVDRYTRFSHLLIQVFGGPEFFVRGGPRDPDVCRSPQNLPTEESVGTSFHRTPVISLGLRASLGVPRK